MVSITYPFNVALWSVLWGDGCCFVCIKKNHVGTNSHSRFCCSKCQGRRHWGICDPSGTPASPADTEKHSHQSDKYTCWTTCEQGNICDHFQQYIRYHTKNCKANRSWKEPQPILPFKLSLSKFPLNNRYRELEITLKLPDNTEPITLEWPCLTLLKNHADIYDDYQSIFS